MARVISYQVEIKGLREGITSQDQLRQAIRDTKRELERADFGSAAYQRANKQLGALQNLQKETREEAKRQQQAFEAAADGGRRSYRGLTAELKNLESQFKDLSEAERNAARGQELAAKIRGLREEVRGINEDLGKRGLGGALQDALGAVGGFDIASFTTVAGAITAGAAAAAQLGTFLKESVEEVIRLRGEIQNLTGATGPELDEYTARVQAISETFGESEQEITNAANAVSQQLGISFGEALAGIEEGFIAGSNQTGQFLDSLREYPAFFKEAEISADNFFRIVNQQATQGIYSDKGVDTIKEANLRLRELPKATVDALNAIGLSADQVQEVIGEQGVGAAIALVSEQLSGLEADSPAVGQALADIFGGPGEDAGLDFILTLKDLNQETVSLIDTNNQYQQQQQRTLEINQEFARLQGELTNQVGEGAVSFRNFALEIRNGALQVLIFLIERAKILFSALAPIGAALRRLAEAFGIVNNQGEATAGVLRFLQAVLDAQETAWRFLGNGIAFVIDKFAGAISGVRRFLQNIGILDDNAAGAANAVTDLATATEEAGRQQQDLNEKQKQSQQETERTNTAVKDYKKTIDELTDSTKKSAIATDQFAKGSIAELSKKVSELKQQLDQVAPEDQQGILVKLLDAEKALQQAEKLRAELRRQLTAEPLDLFTLADDEIEAQLQADTLQLKEQIEQEKKDIEVAEAQEAAELRLEIEKKKQADLLQLEKERAERVKEIESAIFQGIGAITDNLSLASQSRTDAEINALEERYQKEIDLAEGNTERQEKLREDLAKKKSRLERQEFEEQKRYRVATALTSLAEGIVNTLAAPTTIPDPFGTLFKTFRIGVLTATTAAQIAAINRSGAAKGDLVEALAKGRIFEASLVDRLDAGGRIVAGRFTGRTHGHPSGGISTTIHGKRYLVEHGERTDVDETGAVAIINKRSSAAFAPALRWARGRTWSGKRRWLSAINNHRHWGQPYAADGAIVPAESALASAMASTPQRGTYTVSLRDDSVEKLAETTGRAVQVGARKGVGDGLFSANQRLEREQRLQDRTGVQ